MKIHVTFVMQASRQQCSLDFCSRWGIYFTEKQLNLGDERSLITDQLVSSAKLAFARCLPSCHEYFRQNSYVDGGEDFVETWCAQRRETG